TPHDPPRGHRRLAVRIGLHPPAARHVEPAERQLDHALVRVRAALDHGPINLAHAAVAEQPPPMHEHLAMEAEHHAARGGAIADLVTKRRLDAAVLAELEDVLIRADLGVAAAGRIVAAIAAARYEQTVAADEVKAILAGEIEKVLAPVAQPLACAGAKPFV